MWWTLWQGIDGAGTPTTYTCTPRYLSRLPLTGVTLVNRGTYYLITHSVNSVLYYLCIVNADAVWYEASNLPWDGSERCCRFVFQSIGEDKMYKTRYILYFLNSGARAPENTLKYLAQISIYIRNLNYIVSYIYIYVKL
jgi:hypothetical protein